MSSRLDEDRYRTMTGIMPTNDDTGERITLNPRTSDDEDAEAAQEAFTAGQ